MKITVIGCGRWGSFIAWYQNHIGNKVMLYGRSESAKMKQFQNRRTNGLIYLPEGVQLTTQLEEALKNQIIIISVNAQGFRDLLQELVAYNLNDKIFVLCMKGIEISTGKRLTQVAEEYLQPTNQIAVWLGPGHVQEFYRGIPNCMVIDSKDSGLKKYLVQEFSSDLIRFYYGKDLLGNEIGAASKNVIGIAAGMLDGKKLTTLKGALMSRGTREISRLIKAMGGDELSAYGLCHLGDYEATVFSEFSQNRRFGEYYVQDKTYEKLAEGYYTAQAMISLSEKYGVELPICQAIYEILYNHRNPEEMLRQLFLRSLKEEF